MSRIELPKSDSVDLSQAYFDALCEGDHVLQAYAQREADLKESIEAHVEEENRINERLHKHYDELERLRGEIKAIESQVRTTRGELSSRIHQKKRAEFRLAEIARSWERREAELAFQEMSRQLRAQGRELKRSVRGRTSKKLMAYDYRRLSKAAPLSKDPAPSSHSAHSDNNLPTTERVCC